MSSPRRLAKPIEDLLRQIVATRTADRGTRADFSRRIGRPRGFLTNYISGKLRHLTVDDLAQLAPLVGLDLRALFTNTGLLRDPLARELARVAEAWPQISARERAAFLELIGSAALPPIGRPSPGSGRRAGIDREGASRTTPTRRVRGRSGNSHE
jgi:hypothetical protein